MDAIDMIEMGAREANRNVPIQMILHCPTCGAQHIDAPDSDASPIWTNPPHKSHLCGECGNVWRPANVPTTGVPVTDIERGKRDTWNGFTVRMKLEALMGAAAAQLESAVSERDACHSLFDECLRLMGYEPKGPNPGIVGAVKEIVGERDKLLETVGFQDAVDSSLKQRSEAWSAVFQLICELVPESRGQQQTGKDQALHTIRMLVQQRSELTTALRAARIVLHERYCEPEGCCRGCLMATTALRNRGALEK